MDRRQLHLDDCRPDPVRRRTGRSLRPSAPLPHRGGDIRWRLTGVCAGPFDGPAHRGPGGHGTRGRLPYAGDTVARRDHLFRPQSGPSHRHLGRRGRHRRRRRADHRWLAPPALLVGLGLPHQRAGGRARIDRRTLRRLGEPRCPSPQTRSSGRRPLLPGADRTHLRTHRHLHRRLGLSHGGGFLRRRRGAAAQLFVVEQATRRPTPRPGPLQEPDVLVRPGGGDRRLLRHVRRELSPQPVHPIRPRSRPVRSRGPLLAVGHRKSGGQQRRRRVSPPASGSAPSC